MKKTNSRPILSEIQVNGLTIREKNNKDMGKWFSGINSVLFPSSLSCVAERDGGWEECIVTARLSDDGSGRINLYVLFRDRSAVSAQGRKSSFLPDAYVRELQKARGMTVREIDGLRA